MSDEKRERSPQDPAGARRDGKPRRPYKSPSVTEYGSIARLTHFGGSTAKEGATPKVRKGCL